MAHDLIIGDLASSLPEAETGGELRRRSVAVHPLAINRTDTRPLTDLNSLREIICLLRRLRPDVVVGDTVKPALHRCLASRNTGIARPYAIINGFGYALTTDGHLHRSIAAFRRWIARRVLPYASRVNFHTRDDRQFREASGLTQPSQGLVVEGSGVQLDAFPSAPLNRAPSRFSVSRAYCSTRASRNL
jgi:hypothetical protein